MTAGDYLRGGICGTTALLCLLFAAPIAHGQPANPLRYEMQPAADTVAPWAQRPRVTQASAYDPPPAIDPPVFDDQGELQPPLRPQFGPSLEPIVPPDAPPFRGESSWPDQPPDYDPDEVRGLRGRAARFHQTLRNYLGIGFDHSERYIGLGDPLIDTSWLNRPWSVGTFVGIRFHDQPLGGVVQQGNSSTLGLRLGRDFDPYWGLEGRFSYSNPRIMDPNVVAVVNGESHNYFVDVSAMYYPWGDSRWRPYVSAGVGSATYRFAGTGFNINDSSLYVPLGIGLKYFQSPWFSLRLDAAYELSMGTNQLATQSSFTLAAAAEVRFGGRRQSYFPWDGGTILW